MPLDARDRRLLCVVAREGRITNQALAERVHLSPSACLERWKRLEQAGVIKGYRAELGLELLGMPLLVHVEVSLKRHEASDFARFERAIRSIPEIIRCDAIGGGIDYLVTVAARSMADYQALIDRLLEAEIGISRYFTYVVTKTVKNDPAGLAAVLLAEAEDPAGGS
ncbi:Lrp/AsnC family transcriptional regulator [Benzoatithermus flavus]|uniref:Lrp/AsnC family transcriptional regulator n=1 Tax=Benzoatithermus flavus TaxID=3108223 RepID=A0ABU8XW46_9PROT